MKKTFVFIILLVLTGCAQPEKAPNRADKITGKTLTETIQENQQHLLSVSGVIRIEAADCGIDSCIRIVVDKKTEMLVNQLPAMLETYRVDVVEQAR